MTNAARMSMYTKTPADYFTGLKLTEFNKWIGVCNAMIKEDKRK